MWIDDLLGVSFGFEIVDEAWNVPEVDCEALSLRIKAPGSAIDVRVDAVVSVAEERLIAG